MRHNGSFNHRNTPHCSIAMPSERAEALARIASQLGVSRHVLIQRFITIGLSVFGEDA